MFALKRAKVRYIQTQNCRRQVAEDPKDIYCETDFSNNYETKN